MYTSFLTVWCMQQKWPTVQVPSDMNLSAFLNFVDKLPMDTQQRLCRLPMMQHFPFGQPITIKGKGHRFLTIQTYDCEERACERCVMGTGGYRFQWYGPWTCWEAAHTATNPYHARTTWIRCTKCSSCINLKRIIVSVEDEHL